MCMYAFAESPYKVIETPNVAKQKESA
jgi:hypothetical protein